MPRYIYCLLVLVLTGTGICRADVKDPRFAPISSQELQLAIHQTPLTSPLHIRLLSRAQNSGLASLAYKQYSILWQSHPDSPNANLWRGIAALTSWSMQKYLAPKNGDLSEDPFKVARTSLAKAYQMMPSSATANTEYGFFLWQYDYQESKGLDLLKRAKQIAYTDPRVHATLALVYCNPDKRNHSRNLFLARDELQVALKLDNSYAFAHQLLSSVYSQMGQKQLSQVEEKKYLSLIPQPKHG